MFTGIVEELGTIDTCDGGRLRINARSVVDDVKVGDSIAVNGCCLTVVDAGADWWEADVTQESFDRTSLGDLVAGSPVNLERPVRLLDRLGGHMVQGHVDAVGVIVDPAPDLRVLIDPALTKYIVEKGSITVDGISLTVVDALPDGFTASIIPHTRAVTTLATKGRGDRVNVEVDITAKHIEKLIAWRHATSDMAGDAS